MGSITHQELYNKYMNSKNYDDSKTLRIFGLTLDEIMERIDYYDKNHVVKIIDVTYKDKVIIKRNGVIVHKDH